LVLFFKKEHSFFGDYPGTFHNIDSAIIGLALPGAVDEFKPASVPIQAKRSVKLFMNILDDPRIDPGHERQNV
jgi:hypothetical protein